MSRFYAMRIGERVLLADVSIEEQTKPGDIANWVLSKALTLSLAKTKNILGIELEEMEVKTFEVKEVDDKPSEDPPLKTEVIDHFNLKEGEV